MSSQTPPRIDQPQVGFYRTRLVKGGPWVAARIHRTCSCTIGGGNENRDHDWTPACDRYPRLRCEVNGEDRDPLKQWPWLCGNPIPEREFQFLVSSSEWDRTYAPESPGAKPRQAVDLNAQPSLF